jgi:plastocyanin
MSMRIRWPLLGFLGLMLTGLAFPAHAAEDGYRLTIKDHKFVPDTLEIPANTRVKVTVKNADATPEEFESRRLHVERVIQGGKEAIVTIGPLKPGTYEFVGEFHEDTAKGRFIVK